MLNLFISIIVAGIIVYLLLKLGLYLFRPCLLSKLQKDIDRDFKRFMVIVDREIASAIEDFSKWQAGNIALRTMRTEEDLVECVRGYQQAKAHEEEVHGKYLRLRERYVQNPSKLSESLTVYQRYLNLKLKQQQDAPLYASAVTSGDMAFDELMAETKGTIFALEENERKLDFLLA